MGIEFLPVKQQTIAEFGAKEAPSGEKAWKAERTEKEWEGSGRRPNKALQLENALSDSDLSLSEPEASGDEGHAAHMFLKVLQEGLREDQQQFQEEEEAQMLKKEKALAQSKKNKSEKRRKLENNRSKKKRKSADNKKQKISGNKSLKKPPRWARMKRKARSRKC